MISKRYPLAKLFAAATALGPCSNSDSTPTPTAEPPAPPAPTGADGFLDDTNITNMTTA